MTSKGYYSLIQYCPDLGRLEAANIGVLLFCPERGFLAAHTATANHRIIHFFGSKGHDWDRINEFKRGIKERLDREQGQIQTLDDLQRFIDTRANLLQITPPRSVKVVDPQAELDALFRELIVEPSKKPSRKRLQRIVGEKFEKAGLARKIRHDISVDVPILNQPLRVPFAFQNGRFNLIMAVPFESDRAIDTACRYAVEGRSLYETRHAQFGEMQLTIIGKFKSQDTDTRHRVRDVLSEHRVKLCPFAELPDLIDEIRRTGHNFADDAARELDSGE